MGHIHNIVNLAYPDIVEQIFFKYLENEDHKIYFKVCQKWSQCLKRHILHSQKLSSEYNKMRLKYLWMQGDFEHEKINLTELVGNSSGVQKVFVNRNGRILLFVIVTDPSLIINNCNTHIYWIKNHNIIHKTSIRGEVGQVQQVDDVIGYQYYNYASNTWRFVALDMMTMENKSLNLFSKKPFIVSSGDHMFVLTRDQEELIIMKVNKDLSLQNYRCMTMIEGALRDIRMFNNYLVDHHSSILTVYDHVNQQVVLKNANGCSQSTIVANKLIIFETNYLSVTDLTSGIIVFAKIFTSHEWLTMRNVTSIATSKNFLVYSSQYCAYSEPLVLKIIRLQNHATSCELVKIAIPGNVFFIPKMTIFHDCFLLICNKDANNPIIIILDLENEDCESNMLYEGSGHQFDHKFIARTGSEFGFYTTFNNGKFVMHHKVKKPMDLEAYLNHLSYE